MVKTLTAVFDGKVLRLEDPQDLKPNTRYRLTVEQEIQETEARSAWDILETLAGAVKGPEDWAAEHDHCRPDNSPAFDFLKDEKEDIYNLSDGKSFCDQG